MLPKAYALILLILSLGLFALAEEEPDPFDPAPREPEPVVIPERRVTKLPSRVAHKKMENGRHLYVIKDLNVRDDDEDDAKEDKTYYASIFTCLNPGWDIADDKITVKIVGRSMQVDVPAELPLDALAFAVDCCASRGRVPTWSELEARDIKKSKQFAMEHYRIDPVEGEFPKNLAWLGGSERGELRLPFVTATASYGDLVVTPVTAHCMCHAKFLIRVLDEKGQLLWELPEPIGGAIRVALSDVNEDQIHEVQFEVHDHGVASRHLFQPDRNRDGPRQPKLPKVGE